MYISDMEINAIPSDNWKERNKLAWTASSCLLIRSSFPDEPGSLAPPPPRVAGPLESVDQAR